MRILVTGTSGHLGEAIARTLLKQEIDYVGVDIRKSNYTHQIGDLSNKAFTDKVLNDIDYVIHCATLHKPHIVTHTKDQFIDSNIKSTLNLLEGSRIKGIKGFIYTSTTSTFGDSLRPKENKSAIWVTEELRSSPKNIYGVTKNASEELCQLYFRNEKLPCIILKTSRFFLEKDDDLEKRSKYGDLNIKVNEYLNRRLDIEDAVTAHLLALKKVEEIGFDKYIISSTTPFIKSDIVELNRDACKIVKKIYPEYEDLYKRKGWKMFPKIGRIYVNEKARKDLNWNPKYDFKYILNCLKEERDFKSKLAREIGIKGYHEEKYKDGIYPVD